MVKKLLKKIFGKIGYVIIKSDKLQSSNNCYQKPDPFFDQKFLVGDQANMVIFDVGAHHGETTIKYNNLFKNCRIYSFEPFIESFKILSDAVKNNKNVSTFNMAIGNKVGEVKFYVNKFSATNSLLPSHIEGSKAWGEDILTIVETVNVNSTTIDDFIQKEGIDKIDILKLDTQGTEYLIIDGAFQAIKKHKIILIYMEILIMQTYHGQKQFDEILTLLRVNGFKLFNMYNYSSNQFGELRQIDAIFVRDNFQLIAK
jgi:FkbM family methyltransferase